MTPPAGGAIGIGSDDLLVSVNPRVGGTITAVTHLGLGLSVLGEVPWDTVDAPIGSLGARDEAHWLSRYGGGWPLLIPNGGDACVVDGVFHGFHGEGSVSPWAATASRGALQLTRRFFTVPLEMRREMTVDGDLLIIRESVSMTGTCPVDIMWGHHPTFGSDLLRGPVEITSGARRVAVDDHYDPSANPLQPGAAGDWPLVAGKAGPVDLSRPDGSWAALAYLHDLAAPWAAVRRLDDAVAVALSWDADLFPCAWLWYELGGTSEAPWHGRGRVIGVEPNTTRPAAGLANARAAGSRLLRLHPGEQLSTTLRLHVFKPSGPVYELDGNGRAIAPRRRSGLPHEPGARSDP